MDGIRYVHMNIFYALQEWGQWIGFVENQGMVINVGRFGPLAKNYR
jgi:hypothetical protein